MGDYLTLAGVIVVATLSLVGNIYASKKAASRTEALIVYRIDQLEAKVDKHNGLIDRMYKQEAHSCVVDERLDALEKK